VSSYRLKVTVGVGSVSSEALASCDRGGTKGLAGERLDDGAEEDLLLRRKSVMISTTRARKLLTKMGRNDLDGAKPETSEKDARIGDN